VLTSQPSGPPSQIFAGYLPIEGTYDELVESGGHTRDHARVVANILANMTPDTFARSQALAELALAQRGVTFSVYSDQRGTEKVMPLCLVPRVIAAPEWTRLERGLVQRLTALQEFSTLGSGYSLAFRDLQIRGAGELLGAKQSGTMTSVGFELYTQLINEAVNQLKNSVEGTADPLDTVRDPLAMMEPLPAFDLPVKAFIPEGYIQDQAQRLYYYQQMMSARDFGALAAVEADVEDRYGRLPAEVSRAFTIMNLRMRARNIGLEKLDARQGRLHITFKHQEDVPPRVFSILSSRKRDAYLTKEAYIWPIASDPIVGVESFLRSFEEAQESYNVAKAALPE
jgi:transcription-repair coupling factor (superfamily II helicase)